MYLLGGPIRTIHKRKFLLGFLNGIEDDPDIKNYKVVKWFVRCKERTSPGKMILYFEITIKNRVNGRTTEQYADQPIDFSNRHAWDRIFWVQL